MIFGINFNGSEIPPGIKRMFASQRTVPCRACAGLGRTLEGEEERMCGECRGKGKITGFRLAGVGQSAEERDAMVIQATNGSRMLHVEPRKTAAGVWYGIYVY